MVWLRNKVFKIIVLICLSGELTAQPIRDIDWSAISELRLWSASEKKEMKLEKGSGLNLIVLLSPECPMSVNYTLTLKQIHEKFGDQLQITGIIPGRTVKDEAVVRFASDYRLSFPMLSDKDLLLVRMIKGEVTPEAFLFNEDGDLVYSGAIDNWLTELGKKKQKPDKFFLLDAVQNTINGIPVSDRYIKAQGCLVNDY